MIYIYMKKENTEFTQHNWNQFSLFLFFYSPIPMESDCFNTTRKTGLEQIDMKSSSKRKLARARFFFRCLHVFLFLFSTFLFSQYCKSMRFFCFLYILIYFFSVRSFTINNLNAIYLVYIERRRAWLFKSHRNLKCTTE